MASPTFWPFSARRPVRGPDSPPTLLVAEEDPRLRGLLEGYLSELGYPTLSVSDGTAVIHLLTRAQRLHRGDPGHIDAVVADVEIAGRSGIDILRAVRANRWPIPVLLTSSFLPPRLRAEALQLGAAAILDKPLSLPRLRRALAGLEGATEAAAS
jgi:CheY-like chemotaxis protein